MLVRSRCASLRLVATPLHSPHSFRHTSLTASTLARGKASVRHSSSSSSVAALAARTADKFGTPFAVRSHAILPLHIVDNKRVRAALPLLGNAAYCLIAAGFLMTDILVLRVALVGGYTGLVCYHILQPRPLRIPLRWSAVFVAANAIKGGLLALERWPTGMTEEDKALHESFFDRLTTSQFKELIDLGERLEVEQGVQLTKQHVTCSRLYFVEHGSATLLCNGERVATITRGGFVNDVSFQPSAGTSRQAGAYGTAECDGRVRVISWDCAQLRSHLDQQPALAGSMRQVLRPPANGSAIADCHC